MTRRARERLAVIFSELKRRHPEMFGPKRQHVAVAFAKLRKAGFRVPPP